MFVHDMPGHPACQIFLMFVFVFLEDLVKPIPQFFTTVPMVILVVDVVLICLLHVSSLGSKLESDGLRRKENGSDPESGSGGTG